MRPRMSYYRAYIDDGHFVFVYTFRATPETVYDIWDQAIKMAAEDGMNFDITHSIYPEIVKGICPNENELNCFIPVSDMV